MVEFLVEVGSRAGPGFLGPVLATAHRLGAFACGVQTVPVQAPVTLSFEATLLEAEERSALARREWWLRQCADAGVAGDWEVLRGDTVPALAKRSRLADLVWLEVSVAGGARDARSPEPGRALLQATGPVVLVPSGWSDAIGTRVLVAWNGSAEAASAVRAALAFLTQATEVHVLDGERACLPGVTPSPLPLRGWLGRHGIRAQWHELDPDRQRGASIEEAAERVRADLLVMGAWGHSLTTGFAHAGVTRSLLEHVVRPVLLSH